MVDEKGKREIFSFDLKFGLVKWLQVQPENIVDVKYKRAATRHGGQNEKFKY